MLAKADDLAVAEQDLKATIEAAQAKRMAELDKLKPELARVNAAVDKANDMAAKLEAKIAAIHEEWKSAVTAAMKAYRDRERDAQRQDYLIPQRGAQLLQVNWTASSDPVAEINKARQNFQTWVRENMAKYQDALKAAKPPFGARELEIEWHYQYQKKDLETQKKVYEIQQRR